MLILPSLVNQTVGLTDSRGRELGTIAVEAVRDELLTGTFAPGQDYAAVRQLFLGFEDAADAQALGIVDEFEKQIEGLGLFIRSPGNSPVRVFDVQIWSDGGFSCRFGSYRPPVSTAETANGVTTSRPPVADNESVRRK
jgi:hypothetical protein